MENYFKRIQGKYLKFYKTLIYVCVYILVCPKKLVLCHSKCLVSSYFFQKISFDFSFILICICIFFKLSKLTYFHLIILTIEMEANKYFYHIRNFFIPWNVKVQIKHWKIDLCTLWIRWCEWSNISKVAYKVSQHTTFWSWYFLRIINVI